MSVRKALMGCLAAALAGSALIVGASPASAVDPDDTTFTPTTADLIGVGSDTSQRALKLLADKFNAAQSTGSPRIATYAATGGGTIPLPSGAVTRPNGSTAGKAALFGQSNNPDVDFARSSSALSTAEQNAGLQAFPFALDTLQMVVSNSVSSNAPSTLTVAQIVDIYKGNTTNWNEIGGRNGLIAPKIPQAGSGTRSFFVAQLRAANGGVDVVLGSNVTEVQENDDASIRSDANAIAPFSAGRARLLGTTLRLVEGFKADRALYNVVRQSDLGNGLVQSVFGSSGFVCSDANRELIESAGFRQLARPEAGGVCGAATQSPTTDFDLNEAPEPISTTTTLNASSPDARSVRLSATVAGSSTPEGTVTFLEDGDEVAADVPLVGGTATRTLTRVSPGLHSYTAVYTPAEETAFVASEDGDTVTVKTAATITESFPARVSGGKAKGTVTVVLAGTEEDATGRVEIRNGRRVVDSGPLRNGKVVLTVGGLSRGANTFTVVWEGDDLADGARKNISIRRS